MASPLCLQFLCWLSCSGRDVLSQKPALAQSQWRVLGNSSSQLMMFFSFPVLKTLLCVSCSRSLLTQALVLLLFLLPSHFIPEPHSPFLLFQSLSSQVSTLCVQHLWLPAAQLCHENTLNHNVCLGHWQKKNPASSKLWSSV